MKKLYFLSYVKILKQYGDYFLQLVMLKFCHIKMK